MHVYSCLHEYIEAPPGQPIPSQFPSSTMYKLTWQTSLLITACIMPSASQTHYRPCADDVIT